MYHIYIYIYIHFFSMPGFVPKKTLAQTNPRSDVGFQRPFLRACKRCWQGGIGRIQKSDVFFSQKKSEYRNFPTFGLWTYHIFIGLFLKASTFVLHGWDVWVGLVAARHAGDLSSESGRGVAMLLQDPSTGPAKIGEFYMPDGDYWRVLWKKHEMSFDWKFFISTELTLCRE